MNGKNNFTDWEENVGTNVEELHYDAEDARDVELSDSRLGRSSGSLCFNILAWRNHGQEDWWATRI